jgi:hypothetical protein
MEKARKERAPEMMKDYIVRGTTLFVSLSLMIVVFGCGREKTAYGTNLLVNPSFETDRDGIPDGWQLELLHGGENQKEAEHGESAEQVYEGAKSFFFKGDADTQRWMVLSQEVKISGGTHVRLRGAIKVQEARVQKGQWAQCNFILTFFDEHHNRFQELRFADKRTFLRRGTHDWILEDNTYRLPKSTRYIKVGCVLGMSGTAWFDDLWLSVPQPIDWVMKSTKNFDFYSMPGHDYPPGSIENQQSLFDTYCGKLGVKSDLKISYYFYPDSAAIQEQMSLKGAQYISWDDHEIHSIYPNNDHEIIHFITDQYGKAPKAFAEGCVAYLQGGFEGRPVHEVARELLRSDHLPPLNLMLNYGDLVKLDPHMVTPAAASFFGYLAERWGTGNIIDLFSAANGANSYPTFATAFEKVYHVDLGEVETEWHAFLSGGAEASGETQQTKP